MKRVFFLIVFLLFGQGVHAQWSSALALEDTPLYNQFTYQATSSNSKQHVSDAKAHQIRDNDVFLAFVPGAVQMRRRWPAVAGGIWGGMAISGGLAVYEQLHIVKLQRNWGNDNDSTHSVWYETRIMQSKKIRNGALYALGGVYIANYISALLLPDKDPRTSWIALYSDPEGSVGLTYAVTF